MKKTTTAVYFRWSGLICGKVVELLSEKRIRT